MNLFPDKPVIRNYKTKEKDVVDRIKEIFPDFTWVHDKKIQDGCSKRRPDLLLDLGSHIIIIEIVLILFLDIFRRCIPTFWSTFSES